MNTRFMDLHDANQNCNGQMTLETSEHVLVAIWVIISSIYWIKDEETVIDSDFETSFKGDCGLGFLGDTDADRARVTDTRIYIGS